MTFSQGKFFYERMRFWFEIVTGIQRGTSYWSLGSAVDFYKSKNWPYLQDGAKTNPSQSRSHHFLVAINSYLSP
jgi:hypothetical protein